MEVSSGSKLLASSLFSEIDWPCSSLIWHPDLHMTTGFTSRLLLCIIGFLWQFRSISITDVTLVCFVCIMAITISGSSHSSSCVLQLLSSCASDFSVSMALYKGFVFNNWLHEMVSIFYDPRIAGLEVVKFVRSFGLAFRNDIWLVYVKHQAYMKKANLILLDGLALVLVPGLASEFSTGVVKLLGIIEALGVRFGFHKSCLFFLGIDKSVSVYIAA
ncbi:hypothetical protein G9A89_014619 [Geosiphon pyriformis]|nr:hypothetical protein G9A89_014619 [Geosiphon pyriformis]